MKEDQGLCVELCEWDYVDEAITLLLTKGMTSSFLSH